MAKRKKAPRKVAGDGPGPGRPTKKTPELVEVLLRALETFGHAELACGYAQIDEKTYYNWLNSDSIFSSQVRLSKAKCAMRLAQKVEKDDPSGPCKMLKNVAPKLYKDKIDAELSGPDGKEIKITVTDYRAKE